MNKENLAIIFDQYITRFDELNGVMTKDLDEGYKWEAESCFKANWDIDADDFPAMFKASLKGMYNLLDNGSVQPAQGIQQLLKQPTEVEFVRQCFRELFSEDEGDIDARQERIYAFMDKINGRIVYYFPSSWKYTQRMNNVICYLNLWNPEDNYMFKATEATEWANCIEFGDDFGAGNSFSLKKYYRMCDELLDEVGKNDTILEMNQRRFERTAHGFDDKLHLLVYDIIYCAHTYGFYTHTDTFTTSTKARIRRAGLRAAYEEALERYNNAKREKEYAESRASLPFVNLTGKEVKGKYLGIGTVLSQIDKISPIDGKAYAKLEVKFGKGVKSFDYPNSFGGDGLVAVDEETANSVRDDIAARENLARAKSEYEERKAAMENEG